MKKLSISSRQREQIIDLTPALEQFIKTNKCQTGILIVFSPHTTAGITINENADPDVKADMISFLKKYVPRTEAFLHAEGNADAHIKASLVGLSQTIIVENSQLQLGTWQGVFFMEFDGPRSREIWVQFIAA